MDPITTLAVALGLAMDAFAVAVSVGLALQHVTGRQAFRLSFHFGLFQALMPVLGWLAGRTIAGLIGAFDHWLALGLLAFIGGKMILDGVHGQGEAPKGDPTRRWSLVVLSVATSIDALAVGLSLALIGASVWGPALVIGVVAGLMTLLGLGLGRRVGARLGPPAEILGGVVLIGIGVRIVVEHLGLA
jgi:manganese efflux pump family protein